MKRLDNKMQYFNLKKKACYARVTFIALTSAASFSYAMESESPTASNKINVLKREVQQKPHFSSPALAKKSYLSYPPKKIENSSGDEEIFHPNHIFGLSEDEILESSSPIENDNRSKSINICQKKVNFGEELQQLRKKQAQFLDEISDRYIKQL